MRSSLDCSINYRSTVKAENAGSFISLESSWRGRRGAPQTTRKSRTTLRGMCPSNTCTMNALSRLVQGGPGSLNTTSMLRTRAQSLAALMTTPRSDVSLIMKSLRTKDSCLFPIGKLLAVLAPLHRIRPFPYPANLTETARTARTCTYHQSPSISMSDQRTVSGLPHTLLYSIITPCVAAHVSDTLLEL